MLLAEIGSTSYEIVLFLHIVAIVVALAPLVIDPIVAMQWADDKASLQKFAGTMAQNNMKIYGNALIVAGLLGFALSGMSDEVFEMSDSWMIVAIIAWIAMIGVLHGVLIPAGKAFAAGDDAAQKKLATIGPVLPLLALFQFYLMIFKPVFWGS
jgi:uncharacterized membrane protein